MLWHATVHLGLRAADFRPFSHFGTREAALQRVAEVIHARGWQHRPDLRGRPDIFPFEIHPVRLSVERALRVPDAKGMRHSAKDIVDEAHYRLRLLDAAERDRVIGHLMGGPGEGRIGEERAFSALADLLRAKGYDALVYTNLCEDKGQESWAILDSRQVVPAGFAERMSYAQALAELSPPEDAPESPAFPP